MRGSGVHRIRLTGINAMEQTRYSHYAARRRGHCHALAATSRLQQLIRAGHGRVRLAAQNPASVAGTRLRRQASVLIGGRWVDTGEVLVAEGHALWLPNGIEYAWNRAYSRPPSARPPTACGSSIHAAAAPARAPGWSRACACAGTPAATTRRTSTGSGRASQPVRPPAPARRLVVPRLLARSLVFPRGAVVPPHRSVTVHVGHGTADGRRYFWGLPGPAFENASGGARALGDGAYLFDPRGNLRAFHIYPRRI